jgi:very-short-patch-repair endonuclease
LLGWGLAGPTDPVEILVPSAATFGPVEGLRIHSGELREEEVCRIRSMRVTHPVRTCWDLARWLTVIEAVVLIDRLIASCRFSKPEREKYLNDRHGSRGWRRFARALSLVDGRSQSPQESRLRVRFVLAGLPQPEVQFSVVVDGRLLARVDLAWPDLKIAVEYDGLWHVGSARQMHHDRERLNRLMSAGWVVIHVTSVRLRDDFDGVVAEIKSVINARRRGSFRV